MPVRFFRRSLSRAVTGAVLVATASVLSGCGGAMNSFDPTDMLSFLDQKKPLKGERHPVFPEGVPGVEQGVPKELYKGAQQDDLAATGPAAPGAAPAAAPATAEAPPPEAKPKKRVRTAKRRSITAPPPDEAPAAAPPPQQRQQPAAAPPQEQPLSPFPAPLPSGSFSH